MLLYQKSKRRENSEKRNEMNLKIFSLGLATALAGCGTTEQKSSTVAPENMTRYTLVIYDKTPGREREVATLPPYEPVKQTVPARAGSYLVAYGFDHGGNYVGWASMYIKPDQRACYNLSPYWVAYDMLGYKGSYYQMYGHRYEPSYSYGFRLGYHYPPIGFSPVVKVYPWVIRYLEAPALP
ncbi:MAG: hypothetical protein Q8P86_02525 [bacterium]|nr:hypothetical protein [bacterium]